MDGGSFHAIADEAYYHRCEHRVDDAEVAAEELAIAAVIGAQHLP